MKKVLIVDPSVTFVNFVSCALTRSGYHVVHAADGEKALEVLSGEAFDLLICEIRLPGMDGLEFCKAVGTRQNLSGTPIIIITIDGSPESRRHAGEIGCVEYLTKPLNLHSLHTAMQRHLPHISQRRYLRAHIRLATTVATASETSLMYTATLGEGGMYLESTVPCPVGSILDITLSLPGLKTPLNLKGEVVYTKNTPRQELPPGMGVSFIGLSRDTVSQLASYVESYLSDFLPVSPAPLRAGQGEDLN